MKDTVETLKQTRDFLDKHGWTRGALARDFHGNQVTHDSASAACYCLLGALVRVCPESESVRFFRARNALDGGVFRSINLCGAGINAAYWNDAEAKDKADVLAFIDRTIAYEEKQK